MIQIPINLFLFLGYNNDMQLNNFVNQCVIRKFKVFLASPGRRR